MGIAIDGALSGTRDAEGMPASGNTGQRRRPRRRATQYSLVMLFLVAGTVMLATGRLPGIGLALLLSALALLAAPHPDRDASRRGR